MRDILAVALVGVLWLAGLAEAAGSGPVSVPLDGPRFAGRSPGVATAPAPEIAGAPPPSRTSVRRAAGRESNAPSITLREFRPSEAPGFEGSEVLQVIVTSEQLAPAFEAFSRRETRRGIPTVVRTVAWIDERYAGPDSPARVREFLRDAYDRWGTRWALLGGGIDHVPTRYVPWGEESIPTDLYYACLDGSWNEDGDAIFAEPFDAADFGNVVNGVAAGTGGDVWLATHAGVVRFDAGVWTAYGVDRGLPSDDVFAVATDPGGTVWAGTNAGVARFSEGHWTSHGEADGLPSDLVTAILPRAPDDVWVGTDEGLAHWDGAVWTKWEREDGLPSGLILGIAHDGSAVWIATPAGAATLDGTGVRVFDTSNSGIASDYVASVAVGSDGAVWFGHSVPAGTEMPRVAGSRLQDGAWFPVEIETPGPLTLRALALGPAAGEVWAATDAGLLHLGPNGEKLYGANDGLPPGVLLDLDRCPTGSLAVAGGQGFALGPPAAWTLYTSESGLPAPPVDWDDIDLIPDLTVGRIPADDRAAAEIYLEKLRAYETATSTDRVESVLTHTEVLFPDLDGKTIAREALESFPAGYTVTELNESDGTLNVDALVSELDRGWGVVIHICHGSFDVMGAGAGMELLFNRHLDGIDAGGRFALHVVEGCFVGAFDHDCSVEHLLFNPRGGAVAALASTGQTLAQVDAEFGEHFFEHVFESPDGRPAESLLESEAERVIDDPARFVAATAWRRALLMRTFFGAPTLALWRSTPRETEVTHPLSVPAERAPFPVTVTDRGTGLPVEGALVCVSSDGSAYARARTDPAGRVVFDLRPGGADDLTVVVTARGFRPCEASVAVGAPTGPHPVIVDARWLDDGVDELGARGLVFDLLNAGADATTAWTLHLSSDDRRVEVREAAGTLGPLAAGEQGTTTAFLVRLRADVQPDESLLLRLAGTGAVRFRDEWRLPAERASLALRGFVPEGEELKLRLENRGSSPTGTLRATLESLSVDLVVIDSLALAGPLPPRSTITLADGFRVAGNLTGSLRLTIEETGGPGLCQGVDLVPPSGAARARSEPREEGAWLSWEPVRDPDLAGYRILGANEGGGWEEVFAARDLPCAGARVSFPGGESRDYLILAEDRSGNESPDSCFVRAHSYDPTLPGWPRKLSAAAGPAPILVVDLDGDGREEVLLGSMWQANAVHVFRFDGREWTDGDGDPTTDGVFAVASDRVTAVPLAVDLDGDHRMEILAASQDGSVYAWYADPDSAGMPPAVPGWPIPHGRGAVRVPPVGGDLDGDGAPEIVTAATDGRVHAFEGDGSIVPGWPRLTRRPGLGSTPAVRDLDGDGRDDVVFGAMDSSVYVVEGDGRDLDGWPRAVGAAICGSPVLVDVDGDGDLEIFVVDEAGVAHGFHHDDRDADGTPDLVTGWPVSVSGNDVIGASPAVADLDADGRPELVILGDWTLHVLHTDGTALDGWPRTTGAHAANSPVVADLDGDGGLDILVGTSDRRLTAYARDGSIVPGWPRELIDVPSSTPYVADLDGDGDLDVAFAANDGVVRVVDVDGAAVPGAAPWPGYRGGQVAAGTYPASTTVESFPTVGPRSDVVLWPGTPNPFRTSVRLRFALPRPAVVEIEVFDVAGRRIVVPVPRGMVGSGLHEVVWGGRDRTGRPVASGVYFVRLRVGAETRVQRVLRLR